MTKSLPDFALDEPIFMDANIFAYHHASHPVFGANSTDFLKRVENAGIHAVTSNLVQQVDSSHARQVVELGKRYRLILREGESTTDGHG